jgi:signal transduction histidine kinase
MARRLARVPELFAAAAGQYLPVVDAVDDPAERRQVVELLRRAADQARLIGDHALVNALLAAAPQLLDPDETSTLIAVHTGRHAALYGLARLEEADEEYRTIERLPATATERAGATAVQVRSLTYRSRFAEAIALGVGSLHDLGITVPGSDRLHTELDAQFGHLCRWLDQANATAEPPRPDTTDTTLPAATTLINAVLPACYVTDHATLAWLSLEALRIWTDHGPAPGLLGPASHAPFAAVTLRGDHATGYRALQRLLAVGEARGYEPGTSQARSLLAMLSCWFEPIERGVHTAQRAREGLIAGGDLANAAYTYHRTVTALLDCAPALDVHLAEVEAGLAFVRRTGNEQAGQWLDSYRWLAVALRGGGSASAETAPADGYAGNPLAQFHAHLTRGIAAAVLGDPAGLARHSAAAMSLLPAALGGYSSAVAHVLRALALAGEVRASVGAERARLLTELDDLTRWLAGRAADAPDNFLHQLRLVEAERAWAVGDFRAAVLAFDAARRESDRRQRPWHRALITERAARMFLAHGVGHVGNSLLAQAREVYATWGATAKVAQLDWARQPAQPGAAPAGHRAEQPADVRQRATVTTGTLDLLGILSASQALSSETSIDRLHSRVVEMLGAMTGATGVQLLLWSDDHHEWLLPAPHGGGVPIGGTDREHAVPMSVLRYTQRTREPLVVDDATRDDRFARDPHFADANCCSLLAVPVLSRGALRAVLLLENRLIRGAFTTERLDGVTLIAGQLAVSLDNAQLYAELNTSRARIVATADQTRRRIERDLHDGAQQRLVSLAIRLQAAKSTVPPESAELAAQLDDLVAEATSALDELRHLARGIHPAVLAEGGLRPALKALGRRSAIPVELDLRVERRLPEPIEIATYYLVSEALTNASKHARASVAHVEVDIADDVLRVRVRDDGRGGADSAGGSGLIGIRDRVEALGGRFRVQTGPDTGTTVAAELPLVPDRAVPG